MEIVEEGADAEFMPPRKTGDPADPIIRICAMITDPKHAAVERLRDTYSCVKTAVASPSSHFRTQWNYVGQANVNSVNMQIPRTEFGFFVFRDLLRNVVYLQQQPALLAIANYVARFNNGSTQFGPLAIGNEIALRPSYFAFNNSIATWSIHGPKLMCGEFDDKVGFWVDALPGAAAFIDVNLTAAVVTNPVRVYIYRFLGDSWVPYAQGAIPVAALFVDINITDSGYYAVEIVNEDTIVHTLNGLYFETNQSLANAWSHNPVDQLDENIANVQAWRMLGVSGFLKNIASPLNRQGTLVASQVMGGQDWYLQFATLADGFYDAICRLAQDREFKLEKGYYGFIKPSADADMETWHLTPGRNNDQSFGYFPLKGSDYLAVAASCTQQGGGDTTLDIGTAIEYKTVNTWAEQRTPTLSSSDFKIALAGIATMEQHYENEIHWDKILTTIGKYATLAGPYLAAFGPYGEAAAMAVGVAGKAATTVGEFLETRKRQAQVAQELESVGAVAPQHLAELMPQRKRRGIMVRRNRRTY